MYSSQTRPQASDCLSIPLLGFRKFTYFWIEEEISPNPGEKLPADLLTNTAQWTPEVSGSLLSHFGKTKTQLHSIVSVTNAEYFVSRRR